VEGVGAQSSTPALVAGFAADAESEGRGGAEWQMVTRGKAKQCVLDQDVNDGKMLNKGFAKDFKADNSCETAECTVTKGTWLSKADAKKKVGSMVV
jgi:hypothetical protein